VSFVICIADFTKTTVQRRIVLKKKNAIFKTHVNSFDNSSDIQIKSADEEQYFGT